MLSSVISVISLTSQRAGLRDHVQKSARSPIQVAHLVVGYNGRNVEDITGINPQRKGAVDNRETVVAVS